MQAEPGLSSDRAGEAIVLRLAGRWTIAASEGLETAAAEIERQAASFGSAVIDLKNIEAIDTAGAWIIDRSRVRLAGSGVKVTVEWADSRQATLLKEAHWRSFDADKPVVPEGGVVDLLADLGKAITSSMRDFIAGVAFLGEVMASLARAISRPGRLRPTSITFHVEQFAFRAVPIILLINFLVGCIVAQQGVFQLSRFGAATFVVDLIGILVLRELAVLLTSIMIAGRSGSAITAEIGSMKMREEIDALRVMGLDPVDVLILPRILALIITLPLLTFLADMAAIFGGLLVTWGYGGVSPEIFMARLQSAISLNTFLVGLIKAPFMALVIGMIAAMEGLKTQGSAESLGRQVTSSVVKAIFMVIVLDGLFAMFFAAIDY
ncbi:MAG: ABC transporter permease [Beijerinckiaceae bacterium]|nr:ABC transporter permease [Beijerinckiaceae bacterium]